MTFQFSYTHRGVFRDFEFVHGVEKSQARAREARKMHFCTPRRVFAHAHFKLEFDDAERLSGRSDDNRTKKIQLCTYLKDEIKNNVALAMELSILTNIIR